MLIMILTITGAFAVGFVLRVVFRRIRYPWIVTLVLALPALYFAWSYFLASGGPDAFQNLLWAAGMGGGGLAAEAADRAP